MHGNRRYALDKRIYPFIGHSRRSDVSNHALKQLVERMTADRLSAATIRDYANSHVSDRYTKLRDEREFTLQWAERIGLGFELPATPQYVRQPGQLMQFRKVG